MRSCFALLFFVLVAAAPGCLPEPTFCYPGDWRSCSEGSCEGNVTGYQQCQEDGGAYSDCDCSGEVPGGSGSGDETPPDGYYYY